jgi:hypothetical protein
MHRWNSSSRSPELFEEGRVEREEFMELHILRPKAFEQVRKDSLMGGKSCQSETSSTQRNGWRTNRV